jgi:outer membrane protein assembly factor BamB
LLALAGTVQAGSEVGARLQVGPPGAWQQVRAATGLQGKLYLLEADGRLYSLDPASGIWSPLGQGRFGQARLLTAAAGQLVILEQDGDLYAVDPRSGVWTRVGAEGAFRRIRLAAGRGSELCAVDADGYLVRIALPRGTRRRVGPPGFPHAVELVAGDEQLLLRDGDGALYRIDPESGAWSELGARGAWRDARSMAWLHGALYLVDLKGNLWRCAGASGSFQKLARKRYKQTRLLLATETSLFCLDDDGTLRRIVTPS